MNNQPNLEENLKSLKEILLLEEKVFEDLKPLQNAAKALKDKKEGLLSEIIKQLKTDNYSTEFATIMRNKKLVIDIKDENKAKAYYDKIETLEVNEAKVAEMFNAMYREDKDELQSAEFDGLVVTEVYKPQVRKKKQGLSNLNNKDEE